MLKGVFSKYIFAFMTLILLSFSFLILIIALIIVISAGIAIVIGLAVCAGVVASYKKKRASVDYPLEHFARLELTKEKDSFVREYTTRTYVPRSSGGGGGSRHGGGGGHRGGR